MKQDVALRILRGVQDAYERIANEFSDTRAVPWKDMELFADRIADGMSVLDLGCGNGRLLRVFSGKHIVYAGMDNSAKLIEKAQTASQSFHEISCRFVVGNMQRLPFEDKAFDWIFCVAALHHIPSTALRANALQEMHRVLKPSGYLFLTNWDLLHQPAYWLKQFSQRIAHRKLYEGVGLKDFFIPWHLHSGEVIFRYYHAYSSRELDKELRSAGFIPESARALGEASTNPLTRKNHNLVTLARKNLRGQS